MMTRIRSFLGKVVCADDKGASRDDVCSTTAI